MISQVFREEMTELAAAGRIEMTSAEVTQLFGFSQIILSFHIQLLEDLINRLKSWDHETSTISDVLCKLVWSGSLFGLTVLVLMLALMLVLALVMLVMLVNVVMLVMSVLTLMLALVLVMVLVLLAREVFLKISK